MISNSLSGASGAKPANFPIPSTAKASFPFLKITKLKITSFDYFKFF
jgi:hypothetical protein